MPASINGNKVCSKCKNNKPISMFSNNSSRKDGLNYSCRECEKIRISEYKENHKEEISKKNSEYQKLHPEKSRIRMQKWRSFPENAEKIRQISKRIYWSDVETSRNKSNLLKKTEKGKARVLRYNNNRRDYNSKTQNNLTHKDIELLLKIQENKCGRCKTEFSNEIRYTVDHIVPVKFGGCLNLQNVQLLCVSCNSSKGAKTIRYVFDPRLSGG